MCIDPISAVALGGAVVSGIGGAMQAQNTAQNYTMQAQADERDAAASEKASAYEIARLRDTVERTAGNQRAGFAANGVALSGSALDVMEDTANEGDLDVAAIQWNSKLKGDGLKYSAMQNRSNASSAAASAPLAFLAPVLKGVPRFGGVYG